MKNISIGPKKTLGQALIICIENRKEFTVCVEIPKGHELKKVEKYCIRRHSSQLKVAFSKKAHKPN